MKGLGKFPNQLKMKLIETLDLLTQEKINKNGSGLNILNKIINIYDTEFEHKSNRNIKKLKEININNIKYCTCEYHRLLNIHTEYKIQIYIMWKKYRNDFLENIYDIKELDKNKILNILQRLKTKFENTEEYLNIKICDSNVERRLELLKNNYLDPDNKNYICKNWEELKSQGNSNYNARIAE